ncbi:MAG: DUF296 domain-containing protein [Candidatus Diapherotrites archaeon]
MCPHVDAILFNKKGVKKILTIVLDDGEDILKCIQKAMEEHGLKEVKVEDMSGTMKEGYINYFEGGHFASAKFKDKPILRANGNFKLSGGDLWGTMHICTADKKPIMGTLIRGLAANGMEIKVSFVQL